MSPSLPYSASLMLAAGLLGTPSAPVAPIPLPQVADVVAHAAPPPSGTYWTPERMARALPIDLHGAMDRTVSAVRRVGAVAAGVLPPVAPPVRIPQAAIPAARSGPMRAAALPATTSGSRWPAGGQVTRTTGRVFLTMDGVDFVCSASAIRSANRDVVVTAGHCVKDGAGSWAENWTFVPGYDQGRQPYGAFPARRMFVAGPWSRRGDDDYDVGMVAVSAPDGRHLTDAVGGQEIGFDTARGQRTYGFGFPADPPYDGQRLLYCAGVVHGDPQRQTRDQGMRCDLTAGASGGPWLSGFDPATGRGLLTSVSSFKYSNDHRTMYGPYFGAAVRDLYRAAAGA
ncbi:trypsin-like serine peptidase [Microbispora sp. ATCC PTA-5024]|uniref:trypsin-like serine peptidase n=1 Tax=Microbispora sp. ATCC PTA-5024 TaxID=316330 RepID=UPI00041A44C6|nr:trypsin-like serine protease [Microbispora sp. ATCC PTA-5024]